jgi:hypothetical protein
MKFADWLALREPADADARATELLDLVRARARNPLVIHDLGAGTGSMGRWLAARLPGRQHWVLYDRDPDLLEHAATNMLQSAADGAPVTVETRLRDITRLTPADLSGAGLVTASALLDMLSADELDRMVAACAGTPTWSTLSVTGHVELTPAEPLDTEVEAAFNDHQRRTVDGHTLLGPDAVDAAIDAFRRRGVPVAERPSPWRLGPDRAGLTAEWFDGWLRAACEQRPDLAVRAAGYRRRRRAQIAAGRVTAVIHHTDLLTGVRGPRGDASPAGPAADE